MVSYDQSRYFLFKAFIDGLCDKNQSASKQANCSDEFTAPTFSCDVAKLKATLAEMTSSFKIEIFTHINDSISQVYHDFEQAVCYLE